MEETKESNKKVEDLLKVTHEEIIETYKSFDVNKTNLQNAFETYSTMIKEHENKAKEVKEGIENIEETETYGRDKQQTIACGHPIF